MSTSRVGNTFLHGSFLEKANSIRKSVVYHVPNSIDTNRAGDTFQIFEHSIQFNSIDEMWLKWLFQWEQLLWLLLFFLNETGVGHYWKWMVSRVPKLINEDRISNNISHFRLANVSRRSEIGGFRPKSNDKTNKSSRRDYVWKTVVWRAAADELDAVPKSSTVGPAHR